MSDTPETDALDCELHNPRVLSDRYSEMMEHAQKLERERDEARIDAAQLADRLSGLELRTTEELAKLERERDEAREIAGRLAHFLERPAYSVDEAIARMEALNSYKKQKSQ
jgi:hypothetical protein